MRQIPLVRRIAPGSPYPGRAEHWNQLADTSEKVNSRYENFGRPPYQFDPLSTLVRVKIQSTTPVGIGEYVVLSNAPAGALTDPTLAEGIFRANPVVKDELHDPQTAESNQWGRIAIAAEDIAGESIGWAYYTGIALAKLQRRYAYHDHADINTFNGWDDNGTLRYPLVSHPSGSWQILWDNATPTPAGGDATWAVVRHRGIWDRTMAGIAESTIAPGATDGQVRIHSGLANPPGDTGETVTVSYAYSEGSSILTGDRVTVEWQSDYQVWTVYKYGGPAGTGQILPSSVFAINDSGLYGSGTKPPVQLEQMPGENNSTDITLDEATDIITLNTAGKYRVSYNVTVTPEAIDQYPGYEETNGIAMFYRTLSFALGNAGNGFAAQLYQALYFHDAELEWTPGTPWSFTAPEFSLSGTAVVQSPVAGSLLTLTYDNDYNLMRTVAGATGDIHITRVEQY